VFVGAGVLVGCAVGVAVGSAVSVGAGVADGSGDGSAVGSAIARVITGVGISPSTISGLVKQAVSRRCKPKVKTKPSRFLLFIIILQEREA
jgi:hypothetical protein